MFNIAVAVVCLLTAVLSEPHTRTVFLVLAPINAAIGVYFIVQKRGVS